MDPNANLKELRALAPLVLDTTKEGDAERLAELVLALDEWLSSGGFKPDAWAEVGR